MRRPEGSDTPRAPSTQALNANNSVAPAIESQQFQQAAAQKIAAERRADAQFDAMGTFSPSGGPSSGSSDGCGGVAQFEAVPEEKVVATSCNRHKEKPRLTLPLPLRRDVRADGASPEEDAQLLQGQLLPPPSAIAAPAALGSRRAPAALRSGRQLPARLQALDDQTVIPRDVYSNMLKLGDAARGRLGYGQHKLTFSGAEGLPVLRIAA